MAVKEKISPMVDYPSLEEAIATLSEISQMDLEEEPFISLGEETLSSLGDLVHPISWISENQVEKKVFLVRDLFHVVLQHLRAYYKREGKLSENPKATEGIKEIMRHNN